MCCVRVQAGTPTVETRVVTVRKCLIAFFQILSISLFVAVSIVDIITCFSVSRRGLGLDIGFVDHFDTLLVITLNSTAIAYCHKLNKSLAQTLSVFELAASLLNVAW
jgi:hypothetical protein